MTVEMSCNIAAHCSLWVSQLILNILGCCKDSDGVQASGFSFSLWKAACDTVTSLHVEGSTFLKESTQPYQAVVGNVFSASVHSLLLGTKERWEGEKGMNPCSLTHFYE